MHKILLTNRYKTLPIIINQMPLESLAKVKSLAMPITHVMDPKI
jgi:hypothetical protein